MNKRLDELFGEALDAAVPYTWHNLDHVEVEKVMKVFAELIVRECAESASYYGNRVRQHVLKHFGVEE